MGCGCPLALQVSIIKLKSSILGITMPEKPKDEARDEMQEILNKIQKESSQAKKAEALRILESGQSATGKLDNWWNGVKRKWLGGMEERKKLMVRQVKVSENKHLAMISIFFIGAVWMSWAIEDKYDKLRRRARGSTSMKQRQAEAQNKYITRMLSKSQFEAVPIDEEQADPQNYLYQQAELEFDTKADLIEVMENERKLLEQEDEPTDI